MHHDRIRRLSILRPGIQWIFWVLAMALPVLGCSTTALQLLGPLHRHLPAVAVPANKNAAVAERQARQARHAHLHAVFARHHHGPTDDDLVVIGEDATADAAGEAGGSSSAGGAILLPAEALGFAVALRVDGEHSWSVAGAERWRSTDPRRRDRPPQA